MTMLCRSWEVPAFSATWRFLEISPDFRKASLSIGMEPQEQPEAEMAACCYRRDQSKTALMQVGFRLSMIRCVACRALPRKFVSDGATGLERVACCLPTTVATFELAGADGSIYKIGADTVMSAAAAVKQTAVVRLTFHWVGLDAEEQTQKVLADKLRFPLSLSSSLFVAFLAWFLRCAWRISKTCLGLGIELRLTQSQSSISTAPGRGSSQVLSHFQPCWCVRHKLLRSC